MKYSAKYCMDVNGGIKTENNPIIMWPCHGGPNQKFKYNRTSKHIKSRYSKKCVDIAENGMLVQRKCNRRKKTQKWRFKNNNWTNGKKCMNVMKDGIHLISSSCNVGKGQQFIK
jgi:hypothetical protein